MGTTLTLYNDFDFTIYFQIAFSFPGKEGKREEEKRTCDEIMRHLHLS